MFAGVSLTGHSNLLHCGAQQYGTSAFFGWTVTPLTVSLNQHGIVGIGRGAEQH